MTASTRLLNELEAKELLASYGITINAGQAVSSPTEAADAAAKLGFPVALKVLSDKISHKSDLGLVALNIASADCARGAYDRIITAARALDPEATAVVQTMAAPGREVIVGAKRDPQFGPIVLFGMGGVFVEVFKDVSIRVAPVDHQTAIEMIKEIKGYRMLTEFRGQKSVDIDALADVIVNISRLIMEREDILELDANPVMAYESGAIAVDARVLLKD
ncbi:acetate--CoA ligase family protein [Methanocella arvoryzae]|uniref:acetate--CoA ligase (ADP-forming) n=1 Tax=Methanocella arvoryzae (strain DSM 22066 / NBRC 105507 / MRE50) TaxID=351160 RepID=Q0W3R6_METAR|nr:acetate--CoA ligase family protein [Methanocella arvoryzae]CAJ36977.1 acetyl-coa synthetase (ADP-forming), beta subunit [Methanocella arvoryzae MRE50]